MREDDCSIAEMVSFVWIVDLPRALFVHFHKASKDL